MSVKVRAKRGSFKSKSYDNLYRYPKRSEDWVYRKYSSLKRKEFIFATGESKNEAVAYKAGLDAFNRWLGTTSTKSRESFGAYALAIRDKKLAQTDETFSKNSKRCTRRDYDHMISAFGTLRLDQVNADRWEDYISECRKEKPQKFYNRRKALIEVINRAYREGLLRVLPKFRNPDPKLELGDYLEDEWVTRVIKEAGSDGNPAYADNQVALYQILWRQGPRPSEALQYQWGMIRWKEGEHGFIHIPGPITKTRRPRSIPLNGFVSKLLKARQADSKSKFIFPGRDNPNTHQVEYKTGWEGCCRRAVATIDEEIQKVRDDAKEAGRKLGPDEKDSISHLMEGRTKIEDSATSIYILRGTFITNSLDAGYSDVMVGRYTDTSSAMINARYARRKKSTMEAIASVGGDS